jgi:hypothetical protein
VLGPEWPVACARPQTGHVAVVPPNVSPLEVVDRVQVRTPLDGRALAVGVADVVGAGRTRRGIWHAPAHSVRIVMETVRAVGQTAVGALGVAEMARGAWMLAGMAASWVQVRGVPDMYVQRVARPIHMV